MPQIFNPYLPSYEYIPDGEPYVFDGRLYVFGSHDRFGAMSFCDNPYVTWSADIHDLSDWRYEGIIFRREQDPLNADGAHPLFAPDVLGARDGKYYLFYCPEGTDSIGVAVCDTPGGQYRFLGHVRYPDGGILGRQPGDPHVFDPGVLQDEDGQVYLYFGFDSLHPEYYTAGGHPIGPHVVTLAPDMCTILGKPRLITITDCPEPGHRFFEASSMRKIRGKYYFIYSSQNSHELCYSVGSGPEGPFRYGGVLHSNGDVGLPGVDEAGRRAYSGNNHGSLVEILGQWYVFGHRMTNYTLFSRQGVAEPVEILPDGSIPQAEMTSCGLNGGPLKGKGTYSAGIACNLRAKEGARHYEFLCNDAVWEHLCAEHPVLTQEGEDREEEPMQYIRQMKDGACAGFKYFEIRDPRTVQVVTRGSGGEFRLSDGAGRVWCRIPLSESADWNESGPVEMDAVSGIQALFFTYFGEGSADFLSFTLE